MSDTPKKGMSTLAIVLIVLVVLLVLGAGTCIAGLYWAKGKVEQSIGEGGLVLQSPPDVRAALAGPKKDYVGSWRSKRGSTLVIDSLGNLALETDEGSTKEKLNAPIAAFKGDDMEIHALVTIPIRVSSPPKCGADTCEMTAKGIKFERRAGAGP
jgi:hypothetical protein